jgi:hypothetical protein
MINRFCLYDIIAVISLIDLKSFDCHNRLKCAHFNEME